MVISKQQIIDDTRKVINLLLACEVCIFNPKIQELMTIARDLEELDEDTPEAIEDFFRGYTRKKKY